MDRILYDRKHAAIALSVSVRTIDYLLASKQLDSRRLGRKVLIPHGELVRYAKANHYDSPAKAS